MASPFSRWWAFPLALGLAGVLVGVLFANLGEGAIEARVVPSSVETENGVTTARVNWTEAGRARGLRIEIPDPDAATVRIVVRGDTVEVFEDAFVWPDAAGTSILAGIGVLLGLVVHFSLAGHGYVRGTGAPGETSTAAVREDRGFYWRG